MTLPIIGYCYQICHKSVTINNKNHLILYKNVQHINKNKYSPIVISIFLVKFPIIIIFSLEDGVKESA